MKLTRTSTTLALVLGSVAISVNDQALAQEVTWTPKASMPTARYGLAAGVVNNIFYAVGGFNNEIGRPMETTVEAYDSVANAWTTKAPMPTGRVLSAAGVVYDRLYVLGGTDFNGSLFATVEAYNPANNSWVGPRCQHRGMARLWRWIMEFFMPSGAGMGGAWAGYLISGLTIPPPMSGASRVPCPPLA